MDLHHVRFQIQSGTEYDEFLRLTRGIGAGEMGLLEVLFLIPVF